MFRSFRSRQQSAVARALIVFLLGAGWGVPLAVPHQPGDDALCLIPEGDGHAGRARLSRAPLSTAQPDHCAVCHHVRSFRSALSPDARLTFVPASGPAVETAVEDLWRSPGLGRLPARAPPA